MGKVIAKIEPILNRPKGGTTRRALVISISYDGTDFALRSCTHDGRRMCRFLQGNHFDVTWMCDKPMDGYKTVYPTKQNIKAEILNMVHVSKPGDSIWLYYS